VCVSVPAFSVGCAVQRYMYISRISTFYGFRILDASFGLSLLVSTDAGLNWVIACRWLATERGNIFFTFCDKLAICSFLSHQTI